MICLDSRHLNIHCLDVGNLNMAILRSIWKVLRQPAYAVSAASLALASFIFLAFLPNYRAIVFVFDDGGLRLRTKIEFLVYLILSIAESLSLLAIINIIAVSVLFSINIILIVYILRRRFAGLDGKTFAAVFGGGGAGVLSAGCAVCGSFALSAILSVFGAGGALALLPLRGGEFGILSVALLSASIYMIARKIADTKHVTCDI